MTIIDGKKISEKILSELKLEIGQLSFKPKLIDVFIGRDPVIESYVKLKAKRAMETGINFEICNYPDSISTRELGHEIDGLNNKPNLCGLIVQLPVPEQIDRQAVLDRIKPELDVDVITSANLGKLLTGTHFYMPATAASVMRIIDELEIELKGKKVLVIGAGALVGKPVSLLMLQRGVTLIVANADTENLAELCSQSDIIVSGTGTPGLIKGSMVKDGTLIIDAGTSESKGVIKGDVDAESMLSRNVTITPVPGGVGPLTIAMLLGNVVKRAKYIDKNKSII